MPEEGKSRKREGDDDGPEQTAISLGYRRRLFIGLQKGMEDEARARRKEKETRSKRDGEKEKHEVAHGRGWFLPAARGFLYPRGSRGAFFLRAAGAHKEKIRRGWAVPEAEAVVKKQ